MLAEHEISSGEGSSKATLADPDVLANPLPFYEMMRERAPVHHDETFNAWLVSRRLADVKLAIAPADLTYLPSVSNPSLERLPLGYKNADKSEARGCKVRKAC